MSSCKCKSQIWGGGHGAAHVWRRGHTAQVGAAPAEQKYTEYECAECGAFFRHYYGLVESIFVAMRTEGIADSCADTRASDTDREREWEQLRQFRDAHAAVVERRGGGRSEEEHLAGK